MLNGPKPSSKLRSQLRVHYIDSGGIVTRREWRAIYVSHVSHWLGGYVEEWIQTGLRKDGSERPKDKNLWRTKDALPAVQEYLKDYAASVSVSHDSSGLDITISKFPEAGLPLSTEGRGNLRDLLVVGSLLIKELDRVTRKEADRLLTNIIASPWQLSLCKCRYEPCGKYFLHKKPQTSYRHGAFCSREHQNRASARRLTKEWRTRGIQRLINQAAEGLLKWKSGPKWTRDINLKRRLARALTKLNETRSFKGKSNGTVSDQVTMNWVTRNRKGIEKARKRKSWPKLKNQE